MKPIATKRAGAPVRRAFQLSPVAAACTVLLSAFAGNVYAQASGSEAQTTVAPNTPVSAAQTPTPADQATAPSTASPTPAGSNATASTSNSATPNSAAPARVQVTGIRSGIEAAISVKRNSNSIVEAISAEDIGKLPDQSVAESIARLPGVTAQRSRGSGRASEISVRGLSPSFNGTLLNGREMASTGNARNPEFDLFPAELMGGVTIYKTPDASVIGQGLAATIDLKTVQPLDFGKRVIAVNYKKSRLGVRTAEEGDGDRFSLSYIDQFADRTIGVAVGLTSYDETGGEQRKFDAWGGNTAELPYNGQMVRVPTGFTADTETGYHNRDGAFASLQWRPNRNFRSTVDLFYSAGETGYKRTGLEGAIGNNTNGRYDPAGVLQDVVVSNGIATSGTLTNYKAVIRNHIETAEDDLKTVGWKNELKLGEWNTSADLTWSKATKLSQRYETSAGLPGNATALDTISWTGFNGLNYTDVAYRTGLNYADPNVSQLTDVNGWSGTEADPLAQAGYLAQPFIEDKLKSIRLNAKRSVEWGPMSALQFGYNYTDREKRRTGEEGRLLVIGGGLYAATPMPNSTPTTAGTTGIPVASWNPTGSLGSVYELAEKVNADVLTKLWDVKETVQTAYVMGDLNGELMGYEFRGNVGTQFVHTKQMGGGYNSGNCTGETAATCPVVRAEGGADYWNVLPSLNLSFDLNNDQVLRMGIAKVLSRPSLDDLRGGLGFGVNTSVANPFISGGGGNPQLKPFEAKQFDLSYEKYFAKKGYVSVAGFYKKLDSFILRTPSEYDFAPWVTSTTPLPSTGPFAGSTIGVLNRPENGEGGSIKGYELAINIPLEMVHPWLDGFGVMANHSDTKSAIDIPALGFGNVQTAAQSIPLPGLSRKVSNLRLYYEKNGFQIAAAARKRSDFLGQSPDFSDTLQYTFVKGETIVDFQVSYEIQSGFAKGLSVFAQANNWNNAPYQEYTDSRDSVTRRVEYGRTYQFGANYKF
ncbi:TonB-dependent receptor [Massilia sp. YIM B02443]|uniref:TonB-dependent receptor n=1 Tax=Massilia sp. YIM B02443 TaxID=3050127 RepID=UPI0025B636C1|nr:TonB-dependent receptor [Massilia sp. YIM B02443]MDN4035573.1 TonB-dependent receptor [Massilia sp. YIM B02443]